jgi:hypothetical protein
MTAPPRVTESILASLGAAAEYRDAVLGDLAEEFASCAQRAGAWQARRWYYREALRTAPHLIGSYRRAIDARESWWLFGTAVAGLLLSMVVMWLVVAVVSTAVTKLGLVAPRTILAHSVTAAFALTLISVAALASIGGYLAAALHDMRSPFAGALADGILLAALLLVTAPPHLPVWYVAGSVLVALLLAPVGGVVWVASQPRGHTSDSGRET